MSEVVFFEKPGCIGNAKQKRLLVGLGHRLVVRDLLSEPWTAERLRTFFGQLPVADWFNPSAPGIKSGAIDPGTLDQQEALALMLEEPLLIRRPLIETAVGRCCGFESNPVLDALGVQIGAGDDLQACPRDVANEPSCEPTPLNETATADPQGNRWR
jgi:nitrogenase-associated protein